MKIRKLLVVGSGLMGSGIAQAAAQAGLDVVLHDMSSEALEKALKNISWSVGKLAEKGRIADPPEKVLGRLRTAGDLSSAAEADLAIEAVYENAELKKTVFKKLSELAPEHTLFASNTSAIPITELASASGRPEKFLGLHFFSPVPMMQVVEVVKGLLTTEETLEAGREFVLSLKKEPILVRRDVPGFLINRINFPSTMEAMRLVEEGVATVEDVDKGLRLGAGRKMGIFETGDMVGLDVTCGAMMAMYEETGDSRWYPPLLLRRKVKAGHLGRKAGRGWYVYDENGQKKGPNL